MWPCFFLKGWMTIRQIWYLISCNIYSPISVSRKRLKHKKYVGILVSLPIILENISRSRPMKPCNNIY